MFKLNFTKSVIASVFAASALLALTGTPALAGGPPETINEANQYIDKLANDVYVPGHAKQANAALQEACTKYFQMKQSQLTEDWASVYYHCRRALATMREYNTGGLPNWTPPPTTKVSRVDVPSDDDRIAMVPPVVIEVTLGHRVERYRDGLKNGDFRKDVAKKDDAVRKDVVKRDTPATPAASHAGRVKTDTARPAHATAAKSPTVRAARASPSIGAPHASRMMPSRPGHFGGLSPLRGTHASPFRFGGFGGGRVSNPGGGHLAHLGAMHFGRR